MADKAIGEVIWLKRQILIDYRGNRTQVEMAKEYGVSQQTWSGWENGTYVPLLPMMKRLENDTGVPMEKIFFDAFYQQNQ